MTAPAPIRPTCVDCEPLIKPAEYALLAVRPVSQTWIARTVCHDHMQFNLDRMLGIPGVHHVEVHRP